MADAGGGVAGECDGLNRAEREVAAGKVGSNMQTTSVDSTGVSTLGGSRDRGMSDMKTEDFFRILVTELQQQDPFEPTKTADMIGQVSQIRSIEQSAKLNTTLDALAQRQHAAGASDLLGKFVVALAGTDEGGAQAIEGVVTGVRFTSDGKAVLELDGGGVVRLEDVIQVANPDKASSIDADAMAAKAMMQKALASANGVSEGEVAVRPNDKAPAKPFINFSALFQ